MLKKFQYRLTLLFAMSTSLILTIIFLVVWVYQGNLYKAQTENLFHNYLLELSNKLESDTRFSDAWLAGLEADNRLIIHITENDFPLFFPGSWTPDTDRKLLIEKAEAQAARLLSGFTLPIPSGSMKKTDVFTVQGEKNDTYQAVGLKLSNNNTTKQLILLQDITFLRIEKIRQGIFFLLLDIAGFAALFLTGHIILGYAMRPMAKYQQQQTDFIQAASHELRSPLSVIQTSASVIEEDSSQAASMSRLIRQECSRAGKLIHDLLLLASSDSNTVLRERKPVEADALLLRLFESFEPVCREKGISLLLHMPEDLLPPVLSDSACLYQLLTILLENAIAYGIPPSGEKQVIHLDAALSESGRHLLLSVRDQGPGIPDNQKEEVFGRFYRGDPSRSQKDHFGLGLSIASQLSRTLKAPLFLTDSKGGGATFTVKLKIISTISQ